MTILYTLKYWILWPWGCNALGPTGTSSHGAFVLYQHICSAAQSVTAGPADLEELTAVSFVVKGGAAPAAERAKLVSNDTDCSTWQTP